METKLPSETRNVKQQKLSSQLKHREEKRDGQHNPHGSEPQHRPRLTEDTDPALPARRRLSAAALIGSRAPSARKGIVVPFSKPSHGGGRRRASADCKFTVTEAAGCKIAIVAVTR